MGDLQQIYTSVQWASVNPVLQAGQIGRESDTGLSKEGDGVTAWSALPYGVPPPAVAGALEKANNLSDVGRRRYVQVQPVRPSLVGCRGGGCR